jgi:lipid-binding SYLF domain-containing protein
MDMKIRSSLCIPLAIVFLFLTSNTAEAGYEEEKKVESATEVLTQIMAIPEKGVPPSLLRNAQGVAVIPGLIKVGFVLGGRYGRGIMVVRTEGGGWSNPSFVTLTGGSIGWQIGVQSTDIILVFKSKKGIDGVTKGKFTLGVDAEIAAGPVGRHLEAATDEQLKAEIYSYSRSRGLFAGLSLEGAALQIHHDSNSAFYGKEYVSPGDVLSGKGPKAPAAANKFKQALVKSGAGAKGD